MREFFNRLIDKIYKVNDVQAGYFYWRNKLLDICMDIFKYDNLPVTIPEEEIEKRLITTGHCGFIQHPKYGLIVCNSWLYGYDLYGRFRYANFFNPYQSFITNIFTGTAKEIGIDCEVVYNNSTEKYMNQPLQGMDNFMQTINRYARNLSDLESSINLNIINSRQPYIITAGNQQIRDSILDLFRSIKRGEHKVVVDDDIMKDAKSLKSNDIVVGYLTELLQSRDLLLKQFLEEIGIFTIANKKERIVEAEIQQENRNMKIFIYSLLKSRKDGIEKVNRLYGTDITVDLREDIYDASKLYDETADIEIMEREAELNGQTENL